MIRVAQLSFHRDRLDRDPEALLEAWPTLPRVAEAAAGAGVSVTVVQAAAEDRSFRHEGVEYRFVRERWGLRRGPPGTRPVRADARRIHTAVRQAEPDVIHVQGLSLPGHAARLVRAVPGPRILAQDHGDRPPRSWRRPLARRAARAWDAVAFTAREQSRPFAEAGLLGPEVTVHEVLESSTDFTPGDRTAARRAAGVHGRPCLAWVGRLAPVKDPATVLDALARVADELPDPHLWCCWSEAPLLDEVRARLRSEPRLRERVHLLGTLDRPGVQRLLRAADALLLGSRREGSGYAVLEAMASGAVPVVADVPALRRIVGGAGHLFPVGDPAGAADALRALVAGDRAAARDRVLSRFRSHLSWDAVGRELAAAYEACLAGRGAGPAGVDAGP